MLLLLGSDHGDGLLFFHPRLDIHHIFQFVATLVSILLKLAAILFQIFFFFFEILNQLLLSIDLKLEFIFEVLCIRNSVYALVQLIQFILNDFITNLSQLFILAEFKYLISQFIVFGKSLSKLFGKLLTVKFRR